MKGLRGRLTFANVMSVITVFIALGGVGYAATKINGKTIKKASIPGNRLKKNSVTGKQVNESTLSTVPSADNANNAANAATAAIANTVAAPEPFHEVGAPGEPAFQSPWGNENPNLGLTTAAFYKDQLGVVHLKGTVTGSSTGTIFVLPSADLPTNNVEEGINRGSGEGSLQICGTVEKACAPPGAVTAQNGTGDVNLDGVTFRAGE
jgi:hypothetical protein